MLDLVKLIPQVAAMAQEEARLYTERGPAEVEAVSSIAEAGPKWQDIARAVAKLRTSWLVAEPTEPLDRHYPLPAVPDSYAVVAVDGSQIAPDRHQIAHCFVLNVGAVRIVYGRSPFASLQNHPSLHYLEEDMFPVVAGERQPITDRRLAIRRTKQEFVALERLVAESSPDIPTVALVDGTLILWALEAEHETVRITAIRDLEKLLNLSRERGVPVAGYISHPGSSDVVNLLRAYRCGFEKAECSLKCHVRTELRKEAPCGPLESLTDRQLFRRVLAAGERSAIFGSHSKVLDQYNDQTNNRTRFFYLNAGFEVVRVEVPRWVSEEPAMLDRIHAAAFDQAQKGCGYPRALTEAHEQAVVRGADRDALFRIIETALARQRIPIQVTRKSLSKRTRSV